MPKKRKLPSIFYWVQAILIVMCLISIYLIAKIDTSAAVKIAAIESDVAAVSLFGWINYKHYHCKNARDTKLEEIKNGNKNGEDRR